MSYYDEDEPTIRLPAAPSSARQYDETLVRLPRTRPGIDGRSRPSTQPSGSPPPIANRPAPPMAAPHSGAGAPPGTARHGPFGFLTMHTLKKVPEVTAIFWIVKLLTTALGEATSDYLVNHINPYEAVLLGATGFTLALIMQFLTRRYVAAIYWLTALMVAIFGTMAADVIHIVLKVPYTVSTTCFAIALVVIFFLWHRTEHTLSIHSVDTPRREIFYWATVMATFALGTATGDLTAYSFHLGFLDSGFLFIGLILMPTIGFFIFRLNEIAAFWWAYILTRPIGASFADWTGKSIPDGGIGIGDGKISLILAILIAACVTYLAITRQDVQREEDAYGPTPRGHRYTSEYVQK